MGKGEREGNAVDLVLHRLDCILSIGLWDDTGVCVGGGCKSKRS